MTKTTTPETDNADRGDDAPNAVAALVAGTLGFVADSGLAEALAKAAELLLGPGQLPDHTDGIDPAGKETARPGPAPSDTGATRRSAGPGGTDDKAPTRPTAAAGAADPTPRRPAGQTADNGSEAALPARPPAAPPQPGLARIAAQAVAHMVAAAPNPFSLPFPDAGGGGETPARGAPETRERGTAPEKAERGDALSRPASAGVFAPGIRPEPAGVQAASGSGDAAAASPSGERGGVAPGPASGNPVREQVSLAVGALSRGVGAAHSLAAALPFPLHAADAAPPATERGTDNAPGRGAGPPAPPLPAPPSAASAWNEIAFSMGLVPQGEPGWADHAGAASGLYDVSQTFFHDVAPPAAPGGTTSITTNLSLGDLNVTVPGGDGRDIADTLAGELRGRLADLGDIVVHDADGASKR